MAFFTYLRRRRFWASLREPALNVVYRVAGFVAMLTFSTATVAASLYPKSVPLTLPVLLVGAAFGAVVFFVGMASTEVWEAATREVRYVVSAGPYRKGRLRVVVGVLASVIVALVALVFLL